MNTFFFRVNKSFLENTNHPITIPRANNSRLVEEIYEGSGNKTISVYITPPQGRILYGEIYYGKNAWGHYYQIKVLGNYPSDYFGNLKIGEIIGVNIKRSGEKINVRIFSPQEIRKSAERLLAL
jgi:hypothetical protein